MSDSCDPWTIASLPGILQARIPEWVAISFSICMCVYTYMASLLVLFSGSNVFSVFPDGINESLLKVSSDPCIVAAPSELPPSLPFLSGLGFWLSH